MSPNHYSEHYPPKEKMLRIVIWNIVLGDLSQYEKLPEIKPLLPIHSKGTLVIIDYKSEQMLFTIDDVHSEK